MSRLLRVEREQGTAVLTLDDPERRNILSGPLVGELLSAFDELEADAAVTSVVLTGAGTAFCAGADLTDLTAASEGDTSGVETVYESFLRVARTPLPTIAAVNGPAVGAGLNLALACDVRLAAESAWFDTRFLKLGLHPGGGHTWMLHRLVGPQTAAAMVLFGERLDGAAAVTAGLAHRCVPDTELLPAARALASAAGAVEPELLRRTKQTLRSAGDGRSHDQVVEEETRDQLWSLALPGTAQRLRELRKKPRG
ncbi:enoyl-CoA hydratase [Streptomyces longisporoflavus]|uniref:enoyl-CoA hydratase n=1 Tax=Streptomyces longisporoflavus TaxID=28044 RepID=UPI00167C7C1D|nr:enoyl-CoA hydratase [Streptomyces longisporoflavus]GGV25895.1 enoyl-CoA hydratase [Streptomyces longisporoflavus]